MTGAPSVHRSRLATRLARDETIVIDGAFGTMVEDEGVDVRNPLWGSVVLTYAEGLCLNDRIHRAYRAAGAELLIANTHNASLEQCKAYLRKEADSTPISRRSFVARRRSRWR
ncbi:MAG: hypothetical protein HC923_13320 [Myxococcales bacterium]|nr:hypothetical protein [Myxococcales bacterium]